MAKRTKKSETKKRERPGPGDGSKKPGASRQRDLSQGSIQVAARLPVVLVRRVDAHAERLRAQTGLQVSRAAAIQALLAQALDRVEAGDG